MYNVLLIEDNPDHIELISSELMSSKRINKLFISYDGEEALNFLLNPSQEEQEKTSLVDFILLDLKIAKVDGFEVLSKVKNHQKYRKIPVIVLTSSSSSDDRDRAKNLGAEGYIVKSFDSKELFKNICKIVAL